MRARIAAVFACFWLLSGAGCATAENDTGGFGAFPGTGGAGGSGATGGAAGSVAFGGSAGSPGTGGAAGATGGTGGAFGGAGGVGGGTGGVGGAGGTGGDPNCIPPVAGGVCDTVPQCGCPSGQRCTVTNAQGITSCVPNGTVQQYQSCTAQTICSAGTECVGDACKPFCNTLADCPGALRDCLQVTSGTAPIPGFFICTSGCALEAPSAKCGPGLGCYLSNQQGTATDCAGAGTGIGVGACCADGSCTTQDQQLCAPGYACLTDGQCRRWCRVGFADCSGCTGFSTPFFIGTTEYGVCP